MGPHPLLGPHKDVVNLHGKKDDKYPHCPAGVNTPRGSYFEQSAIIFHA